MISLQAFRTIELVDLVADVPSNWRRFIRPFISCCSDKCPASFNNHGRLWFSFRRSRFLSVADRFDSAGGPRFFEFSTTVMACFAANLCALGDVANCGLRWRRCKGGHRVGCTWSFWRLTLTCCKVLVCFGWSSVYGRLPLVCLVPGTRGQNSGACVFVPSGFV